MRRTDPKLYELIIRLRERGGAIVREIDCSGNEVAEAIREAREVITVEEIANVRHHSADVSRERRSGQGAEFTRRGKQLFSE